MSSLRDVVPEVQLGIADNIVSIELVCADAYAAQVLFDDIASRMDGDGLMLRVRGVRITEEKTG